MGRPGDTDINDEELKNLQYKEGGSQTPGLRNPSSSVQNGNRRRATNFRDFGKTQSKTERRFLKND